MPLTVEEQTSIDHSLMALRALSGKTVRAFGAVEFTIHRVDIAGADALDKLEDEDEFIPLNISVYLHDYDITTTSPVEPDGSNSPIYNDETFLSSITSLMRKGGVKLHKPAPTSEYEADVAYSEKGMQGTNYLNLDVLVSVN